MTLLQNLRDALDEDLLEDVRAKNTLEEDALHIYETASKCIGEFYFPMSTWSLDQLEVWMKEQTTFKQKEIDKIKNCQDMDGNKLANMTVDMLLELGLPKTRAMIVSKKVQADKGVLTEQKVPTSSIYVKKV